MSSITPSASVLDGLYRSDDEQSLLNLIDNLRAQKMGHLISIPQLIIIGDQSSGKSTTLETGTSMPFPTADGLVRNTSPFDVIYKTKCCISRKKEYTTVYSSKNGTFCMLNCREKQLMN